MKALLFSNVYTYFFFLSCYPGFLPNVCASNFIILSAPMGQDLQDHSISMVGSRHPFHFQTLTEKLLMVCRGFLRLPVMPAWCWTSHWPSLSLIPSLQNGHVSIWIAESQP